MRYIEYPGYASTNNLHTLHHCSNVLCGEVAVLFSDVLVERNALSLCLDSPYDFALMVDTSQNLPDTMRVRIDEGAVTDIGSHVPVLQGDGNFIGIAKFSAAGSTLLGRELELMVIEGGFENAYYTQALPRLAMAGHHIHPLPVGNSRWFELDSQQNYQAALEETFYSRTGSR